MPNCDAATKEDSALNSAEAALAAKVQASEARVQRLEAEIRPRLVAMEPPLKELRSQLTSIRETVLADRSAFEARCVNFEFSGVLRHSVFDPFHRSLQMISPTEKVDMGKKEGGRGYP